jgi:hypothetical protein
MIRTTRRELEKAYRVNGASFGGCTSSAERLLLFYAVECGLKVLIMRLRNVQTSTDLAEEFHIGHDIREGLKKTYAPARLAIRSTATLHSQDPQDFVHPQHLHQAFRYAVTVASEEEIAAELREIMEWLNERLR